MKNKTFYEEFDSFLAHYGVKGMKWGVRRSKNRKSVKDMSDDELNEAIRRLEKERRYKDLKGTPSASRMGEIAVNALFNGIGQGIASVPKYGIAGAGKWALRELLPDVYIESSDKKKK